MASYSLTDIYNINLGQLSKGDDVSADNLNFPIGQLLNNDYHLQNRINNQVASIGILGETFILDLSQNFNFNLTTSDANAEIIQFINTPVQSTSMVSVTIVLNYTQLATFTYPIGTVWTNGTPVFAVGTKYVLVFENFLNAGSVNWTASYSQAWF